MGKDREDKRRFVLAVDPGGTTGWALRARLSEKHPQGVRSSGEHGFDDFVMMADDIAHKLTAVVCERFTVTQRTASLSSQPEAMQVIGFLRYLCAREHVGPLVLQPTSAKKFGSDAKLRAAGWYVPGKGHANDARRHLLVYLVREGLMEVPR